MSIRNDALSWFQINIGASSDKVFSSKFYRADEAWPKQNSWWFEIPLQRLEENAKSNFHLLCQKSPQSRDFYHLKIPAEYFLRHLKQLTIQKNGKVSIFPSAEGSKLFQDLRGSSRVNFGSFLIEKTKTLQHLSSPKITEHTTVVESLETPVYTMPDFRRFKTNTQKKRTQKIGHWIKKIFGRN